MLKRVSDRPEFSGAVADREVLAGDGTADLLAYLAIARRRGPMVLAAGLLAGLIGAIYALQLASLYTATATLLIDPGQANVLTADPGYTANIDDGRIDSEIAIIKSAGVAGRVAESLRPAERSEAAAAGSSVLSPLFGWLQRLISGGGLPSETHALTSADPVERAQRQLQEDVQVKRQGFSYLIGVSYTSANPRLAAAIANGFADQYLVDQLEIRYEQTRRTNDWLNERLGDLRSKVRDAERAVEVFKASNNIVEAGGSTLSDQQVARLNEQLILARAETAQAQASFDQVRAAAKDGRDLASFADAAQAAAIGAMRAKASEVRRDLAEAAVKYGSRHPAVIALRAQLGDITRQIGNEADRTVASAENKYRVAQSREASIAASLEAMKGGVSETSQAEVTLRELEREARANKALFETFLSRFKETSQTETLKTSAARIVERANSPTMPSSPKRWRIMLMWLAAGLLLGGGVAFLLEQLDRGFHTAKQVEAYLGVPVLASIPKAGKGAGAGLLTRLMSRRHARHWAAMSQIVAQRPLSPFAEAIRNLRMGIRFADVHMPRNIVLISSALSAEGKSTIASNLARHEAQAGGRVVLVDLDLRHPAISEVYVPEATVGAVDAALGEAELRDVVLFDESSGLSILPAPRNSGIIHTAEMLGSRPIKDMLQQLAEVFDLVIVDAAPLLPVTDARALIDSIDALVLVIKWEETRCDTVEAALRACHGLEGKLIYAVLNQVVPSKARHYGYDASAYDVNTYAAYYRGAS